MPSNHSKAEEPELEGTRDRTSPSGTEVLTRVLHPQEATAVELVNAAEIGNLLPVSRNS
jgi:hypothetical protein